VGNNTPVFFKDAKKFVILFTLKKGILIPIWNHRQWCGTFGLWTESLHQV
jgi:catalase